MRIPGRNEPRALAVSTAADVNKGETCQYDLRSVAWSLINSKQKVKESVSNVNFMSLSLLCSTNYICGVSRMGF